MLAFTGAAVGLFLTSAPGNAWAATPGQRHGLTVYLGVMAALAWMAVLFGAYAVYPWYRATPPPGAIDLSGFPQHLLLSNPLTAGWHEIGMEWKEHIAWFAPIALTAVAFIHARYGSRLHAMQPLRSAVFGLVALALVSAVVAGFFGAMLNKHAPVRGGPTMVLMMGGPMAEEQANPPNGPAAAALLSAAIGGFALGVFALLADAFATLGRAFSVWPPTGPLSGVTDAAIVVWLITWFTLARRWAGRDLNFRRINRLAAALLAVALLLTFPPIMDLIQGK